MQLHAVLWQRGDSEDHSGWALSTMGVQELEEMMEEKEIAWPELENPASSPSEDPGSPRIDPWS